MEDFAGGMVRGQKCVARRDVAPIELVVGEVVGGMV